MDRIRFCGVSRESSCEPTNGKHQPMQWTQRGAHLPLQTRTHVLNEGGTSFGAGIQASGPEPENSRLRKPPNPRNRMLSYSAASAESLPIDSR
jgi:hypothetical protein